MENIQENLNNEAGQKPAGGAARKARALSLLSGGLDSQLAVCVLRDQGIEVEGVVFSSPFFDITAAKRASEQLGVKLNVVDFTRDILELLKGPPHGFGSCMNPCVDCHARMICRASEIAKRDGFDFVATGEVLGQRPMSQRRQALDVVAKFSGARDILLRPLSAKLLPPTKMEEEGLVDREKLLDLSGRVRNPQFELAKKYGLKDYPSPAGGCKLTEPNYCRRLRDLKEHEGIDVVSRIDLLRLGRHFRLPGGGKVVVGRNRDDNAAIRAAAGPKDYIIRPLDTPGPTVLALHGVGDEDLRMAARICASYCDSGARGGMPLVRIQLRNAAPVEERVAPLDSKAFNEFLM